MRLALVPIWDMAIKTEQPRQATPTRWGKANWTKMGVLADEMEAPSLYMNAARAGKKALVICTVSDHILTGEATTAEQRQNSFTNMMDVAFDII